MHSTVPACILGIPTAVREGMEGQRVLIIEADPSVTYYVKVVLERAGFSVHVATSSEAGLALAREHLPDLVVCNYHMPEADGLEILDGLRSDASTREIPLVLMTSDPSTSIRRAFREADVHAWIAHPFSPNKLTRTVSRLLTGAEKKRKGSSSEGSEGNV